MRGREKFAKFKPIINSLVKIYSVLPNRFRLIMFDNLRKKNGIIALAKRYALLKTLAKSVGDNVAVYPDVYIRNIKNLTVGSNVSFQPMSYIDAYGGIIIGNDVSIAEGASIISVNHGFSDVNKPINTQPQTPLPVKIENNVWIGSKATILGGVKISTGTIVAAGAVVNRDTEKNSIVAGVPAQVKRIRK